MARVTIYSNFLSIVPVFLAQLLIISSPTLKSILKDKLYGILLMAELLRKIQWMWKTVDSLAKWSFPTTFSFIIFHYTVQESDILTFQPTCSQDQPCTVLTNKNCLAKFTNLLVLTSFLPVLNMDVVPTVTLKLSEMPRRSQRPKPRQY